MGSSPTMPTNFYNIYMNKRYKPKKVFNFVWSPQLAYIVGLITTDGCLSKDNRHIIFTSKDIELIRYFKEVVGAKNKIGLTKNKTSQAFRVQYGNVQMYDWLISIGLMKKKSLIMGKLNIPRKYFIDFLRGHLDGDGSISVYIDKYNQYKNPLYVYNRIYTKFISASEKHILWLKKEITNITKIKGALHKTKRYNNKNSMYIIKFAKKESLNLLSKIYYSDNIPCLHRKRRIYENFIKTI